MCLLFLLTPSVCFFWFLTHMKNVSICKDQCWTGWPSVWIQQKLQYCNFHGHDKYDKCQTLHGGCKCNHWALPISTTFSDLDCISRSQQSNRLLCSYLIIIWLGVYIVTVGLMTLIVRFTGVSENKLRIVVFRFLFRFLSIFNCSWLLHTLRR